MAARFDDYDPAHRCRHALRAAGVDAQFAGTAGGWIVTVPSDEARVARRVLRPDRILYRGGDAASPLAVPADRGPVPPPSAEGADLPQRARWSRGQGLAVVFRRRGFSDAQRHAVARAVSYGRTASFSDLTDGELSRLGRRLGATTGTTRAAA